MKKNLLLSFMLLLSATIGQETHATFTETFIAQPSPAHQQVKARLTQYVQRSFMRKNIKKGNIIVGCIAEQAKDHNNYVYVTPGTIFNEDVYIDKNFSKIQLSHYCHQVIAHFTQELLKEANQTAYISAVVVPVAVAALVIILCLTAGDNHNSGNYNNRSTYLDTKRALRDHDAEKEMALVNAIVDKNLIFDENTTVGFSNNHLNGLKSEFKKSSYIPHWVTAIGAALVTVMVSRFIMNAYDKNKGFNDFGIVASNEINLFDVFSSKRQKHFTISKSWLVPVAAGTVSYAATAAFLEYKSHDVNDQYLQELPEIELI